MKLSTFREWNASINKEWASTFKAEVTSAQLTAGKVIEVNFIKAATLLADTNEYIKVDNVSLDHDMFFGTDFKITYKDNNDDTVNNLSMYVDITTNKYKKNMILYKYNVYKLSNGMNVSIGYKIENRFFKYSKPILVIYLDTAQLKGFDFVITEQDVLAVFYAALSVVKYMSYNLRYEFAGEALIGSGKRASEIIELKRTQFRSTYKDMSYR